ncbi:hypothetical protein DAERI_020172 [Deinococcus aerius]|uniref:Uncharacterized protein n=2 Tax=Deinococcus TaxID=1298 RepID=A0A2I9DVR1_9DEIO|nr:MULTISPECIES: hypothetical protein [Deinococcus]MBB5293967.1 hypothetical protein [Deinococcus metallilatus]QBY07465.1 hypothetical protein E5F05_05715 [Deinococcus metallilatus]RXJ14578.1 hypothetical protein ERJ73_02450 [Deinococcus metallilatus]TLK30698.1 hypothetical protein FCS05_02765 [Deinococcus metallilatus]GBF04575.1 hypothetical protein DAERI_020172 [Deinococcus aerius]
MLYRRQRNLSPLLVTVAALLGLALGFLAGRATAPRPTLTSLVAPSVAHVRQASGALEIVPLEYARAQQGNTSSLGAARTAARQAQAELDEATLLRQLNPGGFREARAALVALTGALDARRGTDAVQEDVTRAQAALRELQAIGTPDQ